MKKRQFLGAAALAGGVLPLAASAAPSKSASGPALLTVSGAIARPNRGPLDPALDQMMVKQKLGFTEAHAFDFAALRKLPVHAIKPVLEYDAKAHSLQGPLLMDVLAAAGARINEGSKLVLRAVDGYAVVVSPAQARAWRLIVATHLDGQPMPLGGLGPLWAVFDPGQVPALAARPLAERFASCPWALYHVEVQGQA
jgi:hypothetical protein